MKKASEESIFHGSWVGIFTILFFFSQRNQKNTVEKQQTVEPKAKTIEVLSVNLALLSAVFTLIFNGDRVAQVLSAIDKSNPAASDYQICILNWKKKEP